MKRMARPILARFEKPDKLTIQCNGSAIIEATVEPKVLKGDNRSGMNSIVLSNWLKDNEITFIKVHNVILQDKQFSFTHIPEPAYRLLDFSKANFIVSETCGQGITAFDIIHKYPELGDVWWQIRNWRGTEEEHYKRYENIKKNKDFENKDFESYIEAREKENFLRLMEDLIRTYDSQFLEQDMNIFAIRLLLYALSVLDDHRITYQELIQALKNEWGLHDTYIYATLRILEETKHSHKRQQGELVKSYYNIGYLLPPQINLHGEIDAHVYEDPDCLILTNGKMELEFYPDNRWYHIILDRLEKKKPSDEVDEPWYKKLLK